MKQATTQELQLGKWLAGAAVGAAVMYMLDPDRGQQRRTLSGDKLRQFGRNTGSVLKKATGELGARLGQASEAVRSAASAAGDIVQDTAGQARRTVQRAADSSRVGSSGADAGSTSGSSDARSWTQDHDDARYSRGSSDSDSGSGSSSSSGGGASAMAGAIMQPVQDRLQRLGGRAERLGGSRSKALAGGAALSLYALMSRRSPFALVAGLAGLVLLARGGGRRPVSAMLSAASPAHPVVIEKTIRIDAAPDQVFDMFAHYENFPRFMSNVIEVRDLGEHRSHWVVRGPAGTQFQWNAVLTEHARPRRLAWESEPGAEVRQTGSILFEPVRNGTRVTVHMSYRPPAGAVGHAIASLLGSDPKRQLDEDLARMKSLVERGTTVAHGAGQRAHGGTEREFLH